jgi:hypothetical protein
MHFLWYHGRLFRGKFQLFSSGGRKTDHGEEYYRGGSG